MFMAPDDPQVPSESLTQERTGAPIGRPARPLRLAIIALVIISIVLGWVTTALSPALAARNPLLLLAMESPIRNMLLARRTPLAAFVLVATARRSAAAVVYYLLGRWYGDAAVRWVEERSGRHGAALRRLERFVRSAAYPAVLLYPGPLACTVAGSMGMRPSAFVSLSVTGSLSIALIFRLVGNVFSAPLDALLRAIDRHLLAATLITLGLVALVLVRPRLSRRGHLTTDHEPHRSRHEPGAS